MGISKQGKTEFPSTIIQPNESAPTSAAILAVEHELIECMKKKREADKTLLDLEIQLYKYETSYLEKYGGSGNILKGFDITNYLTTGNIPSSNTNLERQIEPILDEDRIFTNASLTTLKALALKDKLASKMTSLRPDISEQDEVTAEESVSTGYSQISTSGRNSNRPALNSSSSASGHHKKLLKNRGRPAGSGHSTPTRGYKKNSFSLSSEGANNLKGFRKDILFGDGPKSAMKLGASLDVPKKAIRIRTLVSSPAD